MVYSAILFPKINELLLLNKKIENELRHLKLVQNSKSKQNVIQAVEMFLFKYYEYKTCFEPTSPASKNPPQEVENSISETTVSRKLVSSENFNETLKVSTISKNIIPDILSSLQIPPINRAIKQENVPESANNVTNSIESATSNDSTIEDMTCSSYKRRKLRERKVNDSKKGRTRNKPIIHEDNDNYSDDSSEIEKPKKSLPHTTSTMMESPSNSNPNNTQLMAATAAYNRRNIRRIKTDTEIREETRLAFQREQERLSRITKNRDNLNKRKEIQVPSNATSNSSQVVPLCMESNDGDANTPKFEVTVDKTLSQHLKPHQVKGITFLYDNIIESQKTFAKSLEVNASRNEQDDQSYGAILAHLMGLGKTLQIITFLHTVFTHPYYSKHLKTALVLCPTNVTFNWIDECEKWISMCHVPIKFYGLLNAKTNHDRQHILSEWWNGKGNAKYGRILVMGYELFRYLITQKKRSNFNKFLQKSLIFPGPDILVCDEGHVLKNSSSLLFKAVNQINTRRRIILTGTPLQNNLTEYYYMVDLIKPMFLGTKKEFSNMFINPIENGQRSDSTEHDVRLMKKRVHILYKKLSGFVQRMDYCDIEKGGSQDLSNNSLLALTTKHEYVIFVRLSPKQIEMYKHFIGICLNNYSQDPATNFDIYKMMNHDMKDFNLTMEDFEQSPNKNLKNKSTSAKNAPTPSSNSQNNVQFSILETFQELYLTLMHPWMCYMMAKRRTEIDSLGEFIDDDTDVESFEGSSESEKPEEIHEPSSPIHNNNNNDDGGDDLMVNSVRRKTNPSAIIKRQKHRLQKLDSNSDDEPQDILQSNSLTSLTETQINHTAPKDPMSPDKADISLSKSSRKTRQSVRFSDTLDYMGEEHLKISIYEKFKNQLKEFDESAWWYPFLAPNDAFNVSLSGKIILLLDILKLAQSTNEKVLIFSQSLTTLDYIEKILSIIHKLLNDNNIRTNIYSNDNDTSNNEESSELDLLSMELKSFLSDGWVHKTWCKNVDYFRMDGSTKIQSRHSAQMTFNDPKNTRARLFIISSKAGSLGVNLTGASRIIMMDACWNPVHDTQAIFRAYRIGQTKPVYIYRLISQGTIEQKIYERQITKQSLSKRVVDKHQIQRHFTISSYKDLYEFNPDTSITVTPFSNDLSANQTKNNAVINKNNNHIRDMIPPKDQLLASIMLGSQGVWIASYKDHESLLENRLDEDLTEEERANAWLEYENLRRNNIYNYNFDNMGGSILNNTDNNQTSINSQNTTNEDFLALIQASNNAILMNDKVIRDKANNILKDYSNSNINNPQHSQNFQIFNHISIPSSSITNNPYLTPKDNYIMTAHQTPNSLPVISKNNAPSNALKSAQKISLNISLPTMKLFYDKNGLFNYVQFLDWYRKQSGFVPNTDTLRISKALVRFFTVSKEKLFQFLQKSHEAVIIITNETNKVNMEVVPVTKQNNNSTRIIGANRSITANSLLVNRSANYLLTSTPIATNNNNNLYNDQTFSSNVQLNNLIQRNHISNKSTSYSLPMQSTYSIADSTTRTNINPLNITNKHFLTPSSNNTLQTPNSINEFAYEYNHKPQLINLPIIPMNNNSNTTITNQINLNETPNNTHFMNSYNNNVVIPPLSSTRMVNTPLFNNNTANNTIHYLSNNQLLIDSTHDRINNNTFLLYNSAAQNVFNVEPSDDGGHLLPPLHNLPASNSNIIMNNNNGLLSSNVHINNNINVIEEQLRKIRPDPPKPKGFRVIDGKVFPI